MRGKKAILCIGYIIVATICIVSIVLLFSSRNKNESEKSKRTIGALYMTMNNPYFEVINEEIKAVVESKGDVIETRNFYTVGQVAEFMDIHVDPEHVIMVNNREADFDTLVYENFSIEWTPGNESFAGGYEEADASGSGAGTEAPDAGTAETDDTEYPAGNTASEAKEQPLEEEVHTTACNVTVNGEPVTLFGKERYIFVDIFERITFDLNAGGGRAIITLLNGREAQYTETLHEGDKIELYWEEK